MPKRYRIPCRKGTEKRKRADRREREVALNLLWGFAHGIVDGPILRNVRPRKRARSGDGDGDGDDLLLPGPPARHASADGKEGPPTARPGHAWTWRHHAAHDLRKRILDKAAARRRAREAEREAAPAPEWDLPPLAAQQLVPGSDQYGLCF